jgi:hypothetical protein
VVSTFFRIPEPIDEIGKLLTIDISKTRGKKITIGSTYNG